MATVPQDEDVFESEEDKYDVEFEEDQEMFLLQTNKKDDELIYYNEYNMFESDEYDEGLIGNVNLNVLSKYIALYSQSSSNFFSGKDNDKQYGYDNNTNTNKYVIDTEDMGTDECSNPDDYKTYSDSIQLPTYQIKLIMISMCIHRHNYPRKDTIRN